LQRVAAYTKKTSSENSLKQYKKKYKFFCIFRHICF